MELLTALCFVLFMIVMVAPWAPNAPWYYRGGFVIALIVIMILGIAHVRPFYGLGRGS